ncbi:MAG: hypothetical protein ACTSUE_14465 [Promethearchaeota archaeon]
MKKILYYYSYKMSSGRYSVLGIATAERDNFPSSASVLSEPFKNSPIAAQTQFHHHHHDHHHHSDNDLDGSRLSVVSAKTRSYTGKASSTTYNAGIPEVQHHSFPNQDYSGSLNSKLLQETHMDVDSITQNQSNRPYYHASKKRGSCCCRCCCCFKPVFLWMKQCFDNLDDDFGEYSDEDPDELENGHYYNNDNNKNKNKNKNNKNKNKYRHSKSSQKFNRNPKKRNNKRFHPPNVQSITRQESAESHPNYYDPSVHHQYRNSPRSVPSSSSSS